MEKAALDIYDDMPKYMKKYISNYGWHFNKAAYEYVVKSIKDKNGNSVFSYPKEKLDNILTTYGVSLDDNVMYDYMVLSIFCKARHSASIVKDDRSLALFIKDALDNKDSSKGIIFRMWLASMVGRGIPIDWEELC